MDYPGKVATTLFTSSCNFDCEYCHNAELKKRIPHTVKKADVYKYLFLRKNLIDAVVITGGEPTLHGRTLLSYFEELKKRFPDKFIKIDTNGSNPETLKELIEIVDFIAMDLKSLDYSLFSNVSLETILKSLEITKNARDYEIRITVYPPYIKLEDFPKFGELLKGVKNVAIQQYRPVNSVPPYPREVLLDFEKILKPYVENVIVRG